VIPRTLLLATTQVRLWLAAVELGLAHGVEFVDLIDHAASLFAEVAAKRAEQLASRGERPLPN